MSSESERVPSFFLIAENDAARTVINDIANLQYREPLDEQYALHLVFFSDRRTIDLGRSGCAVTLRDVRGASISKRHCYFEYSTETGAVVLYDQSPGSSTQVFDDDATITVPMSQARHSVVVTRRFNQKIAIGNRKYYKFSLKWDSEPLKSFLTENPQPHQHHQLGPLRSVYDPSKIRYIMGDELGRGAFGTVTRAVDICTGSAMAVKRFHSLEGKRHILAIREVNNMLKLSNNGRKHKHILHILGHEYDSKEYKWIEIFMPLKDGSVKSLILSPGRILSDEKIAHDVLQQMLKALRYMAKHNIVHRDIKPDNILYDVRDDNGAPYYHFLLADFGLSNNTENAHSFVGTEKFMAPEVLQRGLLQSDKADIWSLFATIVWIHDAEGFRDFQGTNLETHTFLIHLAQEPTFTDLRDMAHEDPRARISASDLLVRLENRSEAEIDDDPIPQFQGLELDGHASWSYNEPIPEHIEAQFSSSNMYSPSEGAYTSTAMDGNSALPDFASGSQDAYRPRTVTYTAGRLGADYRHYDSYEAAVEDDHVLEEVLEEVQGDVEVPVEGRWENEEHWGESG